MSSRVVVDQAVALVEAARALVDSPWGQVEEADALEVTAVIATARALLDASLLRAAEQVEVTGAAIGAGWAGTKDFVTHVTGGHKGSGGGLMRAAEKLSGLPRVREALDSGAITLPQARAIADKAHGLTKVSGLREPVADGLLELALTQGLDASGLQRAFPDVLREVDPEGYLCDTERGRPRAERGAHLARHLSVREDSRGGMILRGSGTIEDAQEILAVLLSLAAPRPAGSCGGPDPADGDGCADPGCGHDGRDPRDGPVRMWDALLQMARVAAGSPMSHDDHGVRPIVMVTTDAERLAASVADAALITPLEAGRERESAHVDDVEYVDGTPLSVHALRRLACDAEILPAVLGSQGQVLDVGRRQRLVTTAIWLALVLRDRHCAFPGCSRPPCMSDAHHVVHWADGGATSLDNLVLLCRHHHRFVHASPWEVSIDPCTRLPVWVAPGGRRDTDPGVRPMLPPPYAA